MFQKADLGLPGAVSGGWATSHVSLDLPKPHQPKEVVTMESNIAIRHWVFTGIK